MECSEVTPKQAAEFLEVKVGTLAVWRCKGIQKLPFIRYGRRIKYRMEDLRNFKARRTHYHSSE